MIKEIWILRHQETIASTEDRYCSFSESPLTDFGKASAALFCDGYKKTDFDRIYSSPRQRALDSVKDWNNKEDIIITDALAEINHGSFEGRTKAGIQEKFTKETILDSRVIGYPDGETFWDVQARVIKFINEVKLGRVLFITHKTTARILIACMLDIPLLNIRNKIDMSPGGLSIWNRDKGLIKHNDTSYQINNVKSKESTTGFFWIPEAPNFPGIYAKGDGTYTLEAINAIRFITKLECQEWCNRNLIPVYTPREHGFF